MMGNQKMWFHQKSDVIIPTWNSMPELEFCLKAIRDVIPQENLNNIFVVDKNSDDDTVSCAEKYGCKVITDSGTLGSARLTGLREATTEWVFFIDSDIEIDVPWFNEMMYISEFLSKTRYRKFGWIFGRTIDNVEPLKSEKEYKFQQDFKDTEFRIVKGRAYTHNSIVRREPLLSAPIKFVNAWEDYLLAEEMRKHGYYVIEVFTTVTQYRKETYLKNGMYTEAWGQVGMIGVRGVDLYTLFRPFWFPYWGLKCMVHFADVSHFVYNLKVCFSIINGCIHKNNFVEFKRRAIQ